MTATPGPPNVAKKVDGEDVSIELRGLLHAVHQALATTPVVLKVVVDRMDELFAFLSSPQGRKRSNLWVTDRFFGHSDNWEGIFWDNLPGDLTTIVDDIGTHLHNAWEAPALAQAEQATPEQFRQRLADIQLPGGAV